MPESLHPNVRYEKSDADVRGIVGFGVALGVVLVVIHFALVGLFELFKGSEDCKDPRLPELAASERARLPRDLKKIPAPRLQESQTIDMDALRQREEAHLASYGWVDARAGVVRIPIADAMRLLADPQTAAARGILVKRGGRR
jgi:hypothetical protein